MILKELSLQNFRSYSNLKIEFGEGINIFVGENGSGKTNLCEAISYLSNAKSFRNNEDKDLIKINANNALINAKIELRETKKDISINISKQGKNISLNSKKVGKVSSLFQICNVVSFKPSDVTLFVDSPSDRRKFIDSAISKENIEYLENLINYEKVLKERNELLKLDTFDKNYLEIINEKMVEFSLKIIKERKNYIDKVNTILSRLASKIYGRKRSLNLIYKSFVKNPDLATRTELKQLFKNSFGNDLRKRQTNIGPHREDISMLLDGLDICEFASQGENRLAVLSLKLVTYFLIKDEERKPIMILDDVFSELDDEHQKNLIDVIRTFKQVFITTTKINIENATYFDVVNHTITRRIS